MRFDPKEYKKDYDMRTNHFLICTLVFALFVAGCLRYEASIFTVGVCLLIPAWIYCLLGVLFTRQAYRDVAKWDKMGINEL